MSSAASDRFQGALGSRRGSATTDAGRVVSDEDVIRAWLRGETGTRNERFSVRTHPDGPDPSAFFLVDATQIHAIRGHEHGLIAGHWRDSDGTLNIATSPEYPGELAGPVTVRTYGDGCRPLLTTTTQLFIDADFAAGNRPGDVKLDRSEELRKEREFWQAERAARENGEQFWFKKTGDDDA